jgi:hypothetical protein
MPITFKGRALPWAACAIAALSCVLPSALSAQAAAGSKGETVPRDFLKKKPARSGSMLPGGPTKGAARAARLAKALTAPSGFDTLPHWSDQFTAPGFDYNGNPQSVWPYTMVGAAPESGRTTVLNAPIIPVTLEMLDKNGSIAIRSGVPLILKVTPAILGSVLKSPVFQPWIYTSGVGQFNDQLFRAEFHDRLPSRGEDDRSHEDEDSGGWHTLLAPAVKKTEVMRIPYGSWYYALNADGSCCAFALVDETAFANALFPPTAPPDNSTTIGAAEVARDMTPKDLTALLFNNVYLYNGDPSICCVLGFHSYDIEPGDAHNGNREKHYVFSYASWMTTGLFSGGFEDVTALSHEISETYNDPFINNETPWWEAVDPFTGYGNCQDNLETGDVIEVLSANPVFAISMNGRTYHPQNEALFNWFAFQSPSRANLGAYSFPDETTLTSLSPGPLLPGCVPAT